MEFSTRKRVSLTKRACDFCRRRKIKCNGKHACGQCLRLNKGNCTYDIPALKRGPKRPRTYLEYSTIKHDELEVSSIVSLLNTSPRIYSLPEEYVDTITGDKNQIPPSETTRNSPTVSVEWHKNCYDTIAAPKNGNSTQIDSNLLFSFSTSSHTPSDSSSCFSVQSSFVDTATNYILSDEELNQFPNWPISYQRIDFVKLILFLNNLPKIQLEADQVNSIVSYFINVHSCAPVIDPSYFFYHLSKSLTVEVKVLLDNIFALQCLSEINMAMTVSVLQKSWNNSLKKIYRGDDPFSFQAALYVLNITIYRLAPILL